MDTQQQFHFRDGTSVASLDELKEKIETISYADFYHHVNSTRNDFANWVRYVLKDDNLANNLEKTTSIVETVEVMNDYLYPRAHSGDSEDIQSRIEHQLNIQTPQNEGQKLDEPPTFREEERDVTQQEDVLQEEQKSTLAQQDDSYTTPSQQVQEEPEQAFSQEEKEFEQAKKNSESKETDSDTTNHYRVSSKEKKELKEFHHNLDKIIVKDFIWGMIFGLIIGFVLARMLTL